MKLAARIAVGVLAVVAVAAVGFGALYASRIQTANSIEKLTDYDDYNLYRMQVRYDYDLDKMIANTTADNQSFIDAAVKQALPLLPVSIKAPTFGCSAFHIQETGGDHLMGRNYDFKRDTSAMLVCTAPKDGYKSIAFAALDNLGANQADASTKAKIASLLAPFACLDGINEKGVSIAVLTLDSEPTKQDTGKPVLATTMAIRLVLDRAATTAEAVELLQQYDMFATSGRDYHFYITDAAGDGRVIEYDCDDPARPMVVTPSQQVTNFFVKYKENVLPNQKNGIYGHGRERYDAIEEVLDSNAGAITPDIAWQALQAASQEPNPKDVTSNTQWSILYDNTNCTATIALRRDWGNKTEIDLNSEMGF
ncbi:MAG: linear amide C-N hydrolase [Eubacteriales bacterium]|nr:linear amide C-N hydrolase [Eubacteriales bacterium]